MKNPMEECPPDELLTGFSIHCALNSSQEHPDGTWSVHCPQWKFHGHHKNLTRIVAMLVAEIESHNDECEGYPPVHKNFAEWCAQNGLLRLRKEHWPKPPPVLRGSMAKKWKPVPDDGKCTPNRRIDQ